MDSHKSLNGLIQTTVIFLQLTSSLDARSAMEVDPSQNTEIWFHAVFAIRETKFALSAMEVVSITSKTSHASAKEDAGAKEKDTEVLAAAVHDSHHPWNLIIK